MATRTPETIRGLGRRDDANPFPIPPSASESASAAPGAVETGPTAAPSDFRPLIVVSSIIGAAVVLLFVIMACIMLRRARQRRHQTTVEYYNARERDPNLSWQEYGRRCKLSNSTMFLEAESQRAAMISKSLRSRQSLDQAELAEDAIVTDPGLPPSPPTPTRSSLWSRGRQRSSTIEAAAMADYEMDDKEMLLPRTTHKRQADVSPERPNSEDGAGSLCSPGQTLSSSQRLLWELPDGKKCPPAWGNGNARWSGDVRDAPPAVPPPSMRARTPPIWAHPAFRPEGSGMGIVAKSFTNDTGLRPSERIKDKLASP